MRHNITLRYGLNLETTTPGVIPVGCRASATFSLLAFSTLWVVGILKARAPPVVAAASRFIRCLSQAYQG